MKNNFKNSIFLKKNSSIIDIFSKTIGKKELHNWFVAEYPKHAKYKLDMGKSCVRFKKMDDIPYDLIEELLGKMTVEEWISIYESVIKA